MDAWRIGLIIGTDGEYSRRTIRGISAFAQRSSRPWLFRPTSHHRPDLRGLARWSPTGVIAYLGDSRIARRVASLGVPVINVGAILDGPQPPNVGNDDDAIGFAAAEHLWERHFRRFAFVGRPGARYSDRRQAGFVRALRTKGYACDCYLSPGVSGPEMPLGSRADQDRVRRWIGRLATPVGIMTCNDTRAWQVIQACRELGRHVPGDVSVVGVDNDEAWCLLAHPPLSSVVVDAERIGFLASAELERAIRGMPCRPRTAVPPLGVVARRSSDTVAVEDATVAEALGFIRDNAGQPFGIDDVLTAIPVSRRALERSFRLVLGCSPASEIRRARLRRARDLLATTDLSMAEVARLSGYASQKQLSIAFKRQMSRTPSEYRKHHRLGPDRHATIDSHSQAR